MHLSDLLAKRFEVGAGLFLMITRRCPLHCAHCFTESTLDSPKGSPQMFLSLVRGFNRDTAPRVILISGGEPLLDPVLVERLARTARRAGTATYVLTGGFFGRTRKPSPRIADALLSVDHAAFSIDAWHEDEIPRESVFQVMRWLRTQDKDVSVQTVVPPGDRGQDYIDALIGEVRDRFEDQVPILVGTLSYKGRAEKLAKAAAVPQGLHQPVFVRRGACVLANWPLVSHTGVVSTCCNQDVVDSRRPQHLIIGDAVHEEWPAIHSRLKGSPVARIIRTGGPDLLASTVNVDVSAAGSFCSRCQHIDLEDEEKRACAARVQEPGFARLERAVSGMLEAAGASGFARDYGDAQYAHLATLGAATTPEAAQAP